METPTSPAGGMALARARQLFFEEGAAPGGLVHDAVWRSWQRCAARGHRSGETMVFNQVRRAALDALLEQNRQLIAAAEPAMRRLAASMSGTGYGLILTDSAGLCVAAHGPIASCGSALRQALRPGVDLSEQAVGTNAMCAAMAEARPIGIFGAEHYFAQNQAFQCVAAPIFSPDGELAGAIDITRDTPGPQLGALSMMLDCAAAIESALLLQRPAHTVIGLHWHAGEAGQFGQALLAFGADGEVLALNSAARRLLGVGAASCAGLRFRDLFLGDYAGLLTVLAAAHPAQLTLQSGLRIYARARTPERGASVRAVTAAPARPAPQSSADVEFGDPAVRQALTRAVRAVNAGLPVMISGETGTGKEVAARALHAASACAAGPFVAINCGAIPRELIEGELFGYADGAFTGARRGGAKGRIEEANGGTLFLDEIGDMPLDLQTRLLRVLESREVTRLGESAPRKLAIQLLSATHQDLEALVGAQRFRSDLYYRLSGMALALPPLRERGDLGALIDAVLAAEGIDAARLSADARSALEIHGWPGNTRELRTALRFARAMADEHELILCSHLPANIAAAGLADDPSLPRRREPNFASTEAPSNLDSPLSVVSQAQSGALGSPCFTPPGNDEVVNSLRDVERDMIDRALAAADGNITAAARRLGISRATLHRRLQRAAEVTPSGAAAAGAG